MLDFTSVLARELVAERAFERDRFMDEQRWARQLRAHKTGPSMLARLRRAFADSPERRMQEQFAGALDAAQREGITIDAWYSFQHVDADLSARANWAGLNDAVEIQNRRRPHAA